MAANEQDEDTTEKKSGSMMTLVIWLVVVVVSIGGGFAAPLVFAELTKPADPSQQSDSDVPDPDEEVVYVDFDEIVAVLGNSRFSRYLKINLSLQVAKSQRAEVEKKIDARSAVLKNRILAHVAEISEEKLAGQHGHNQLRREMHSFFNEILFDDGIERVQDVLFRELTVQ